MKALVFTLAGLLLSQAAHAAGCSEAEAKRLLLERVVANVAGADFSEVKVRVEKKVEGRRPYLITSMYATYANPSGSVKYGWQNVEIQPRNPCFNSGEAGPDVSYLRGGTEPETKLNDYLRDNQMGTLMRAHTERTSANSASHPGESAAPSSSPSTPTSSTPPESTDSGSVPVSDELPGQ